MTGDATRRGPGPRREWVLLILGLTVAAALGWAAWLVGQSPDELAEAEVASTARVVARNLTEEWQSLRESDAFRELSDGSVDELFALGSKPVQLVNEPEADENAPRAFLALLDEARRLARSEEWEDMEAVLVEARKAAPTAEDQPPLYLLELKLAVGQGDQASISNGWDRLVEEVPWSITRNERPIRLLAGWVAANALEPGRMQAFHKEFTGTGADHILASDAGEDRVECTQDGLALIPGPDLRATLEICAQTWPEWTQELRTGPAWLRRKQRVLRTVLGSLESVGDAWSLRMTPIGQVAMRTDHDPFLVVKRTDLGAQLRALLPLPRGFTFAVRGEKNAADTPLIAPLQLAGAGPEISLYHSDPVRLVQAGVRRRRLTAWSLLGLAVGCIGASLITARALRRERHVAALRSTFVAGISHDLRTPLASILLMAENLQSGRVGTDRTQAYSSAIAGEAERLRRRVDDVLDFARIERGEPARAHREITPCEPLVSQIFEELEAQARESKFSFHGEVVDLPASASIDPDALRRIAGNLGQNALRHSGGSELLVRVQGLANELVLVVQDDGRGIPAAQRTRVLAPFERLSTSVNHKGGTGLGLAIVASLVDAHGGRLAIDDGDGKKGTRFTVHIPIDEDPV